MKILKIDITECTESEISQWKNQCNKDGLIFNKSTKLYAARHGGAIVGFAGVMTYKKKAIFKNSYVVPEYRRRGIWKLLFKYRVDVIRQKGIKKIEATCTSMSIEAYLKMGARVIKQYKKFATVEISI